MLDILKDKKVVFFDVGYTLDYPASGDWILTNKFYEVAGDRIEGKSKEEIGEAARYAFQYLAKHHHLKGLQDEIDAFVRFFTDFSDYLKLGLTKEECECISKDRAGNMANYIAYEDAVPVLRELSKTHKLGIISDTWPSITEQLTVLGLYEYFSFFTFSCDLGVFKPDRRMYEDALAKAGCKGEDAVFIDDVIANLEGAAMLGITPIMITAHESPVIPDNMTVIKSLAELLL